MPGKNDIAPPASKPTAPQAAITGAVTPTAAKPKANEPNANPAPIIEIAAPGLTPGILLSILSKPTNPLPIPVVIAS